jgi:outer membrane protein OmpA-like peptidoglycan-associated protein
MNICTYARTPSTLVAMAVALVLSGCVTAPRQDAKLDAARSSVAAAHGDPRVIGDARAELAKADAALSTADALLAAGKPLSDVEHHAYLADRLARTAQEQGKLLASEKQIAELGNRRNAVLLAARDGEVRQANAVAANMTQAASAARSDAAASAQDTATANERAARMETQLIDLQGTHTDRGVVVTLGDVQFASGRSELQESSQRSIGKLTTFLADHPQRTVRVEGFTDSIGGDDYNRRLSERRAASVADALTHGGIDPRRIQTEGYGNAYAVAGNDTVTGRQQNRRVEVVISDNDQPISERAR